MFVTLFPFLIGFINGEKYFSSVDSVLSSPSQHQARNTTYNFHGFRLKDPGTLFTFSHLSCFSKVEIHGLNVFKSLNPSIVNYHSRSFASLFVYHSSFVRFLTTPIKFVNESPSCIDLNGDSAYWRSRTNLTINLVGCSFLSNYVVMGDKNYASGQCGGALSIYSPFECSIKRCSFDQCTSGYRGGAVYIQDTGLVGTTITECNFSSNMAYSYGTAICFNGANNIGLSFSYFISNFGNSSTSEGYNTILIHTKGVFSCSFTSFINSTRRTTAPYAEIMFLSNDLITASMNTLCIVVPLTDESSRYGVYLKTNGATNFAAGSSVSVTNCICGFSSQNGLSYELNKGLTSTGVFTQSSPLICPVYQTPGPTQTIGPTPLNTPAYTPQITLFPTITQTLKATLDPTHKPTFVPTPVFTPYITPKTTPKFTPLITPIQTLVETPINTLVPTPDRTLHPTLFPTPEYTPLVTPFDTPFDTIFPTVSPTLEATLADTFQPTLEPTPIITPEFTPLITPEDTLPNTPDPTLQETHEPTPIETFKETPIETLIETLEPTLEPTFEETFEPTLENTLEPTLEPTHNPTYEPTLEPTFKPTHEPTLDPTFDLTPELTSDPTPEQTLIETPCQTLEPTLEETPEPTLYPTPIPTLAFSPFITPELTFEPTISPTLELTLMETPQITATLEPTVPMTPPQTENILISGIPNTVVYIGSTILTIMLVCAIVFLFYYICVDHREAFHPPDESLPEELFFPTSNL